MTSSTWFCMKHVALTGAISLLTLFICSNLSTTHGSYISLNWRCNIAFNYTHQYMDANNTWLGNKQAYENCWNNTYTRNWERNVSGIEDDCIIKCGQVYSEVAKEDGTLNVKYVEKVKEMYRKYSNARVSFINKLGAILLRCVKEAEETYKSLSANNQTECKINGIYNNIATRVFWKDDLNATLLELCGDT